MLDEAVERYEAGVFEDDEARNEFFVHIRPLVRRLVGRVVSALGAGAARNIDDVIGYVNVRLLESWLPTFLASNRKSERIPEAAKYLVTAIRGYVLNHLKKDYDPRTVPFVDRYDRSRSFVWKLDREELDAAYERMLAEHVALRPRPDLDLEVVEKLMRYLVWEEYKRTDGVPG